MKMMMVINNFIGDGADGDERDEMIENDSDGK